LTPKLAKELDDIQNSDIEDTSISSLFLVGLDNTLPPWMAEMGVDFLSACQSLHDTDNFWDQTGPTEDAVEFVKDVINPLIGQ
jgi:hypothetical protein